MQEKNEGNTMSEYSMLEATIETYIDIEDLGITDFDNLTDEQVLGLFDAYEELHHNGRDEMVIEIPTFNRYNLQEKYGVRYGELCKKRMEAILKQQLKVEVTSHSG